MRSSTAPTHRTRALALAAGAALVSGGLGLATAGTADAAASFPAHYAAPYLQISTSDSGDMAADMAATGLKYYTLAFLIPQSGCTPEWEDGGYSVGQFNAQISSLQAAGGNVIVSFGGADGGELAQTCTSVSSLTAAYLNVVNTTGATRLRAMRCSRDGCSAASSDGSGGTHVTVYVHGPCSPHSCDATATGTVSRGCAVRVSAPSNSNRDVTA